MQEILVSVIVIMAISYIGYRLYKTFTKKKCDDDNCGCR